MSRRNHSDLPPPSLADLAGYPTHGATVLCVYCDRGASFAWPTRIERHGARATWTAIGSRFRCRECDRRPVLEVRWRADLRPPLASWEIHEMAEMRRAD